MPHPTNSRFIVGTTKLRHPNELHLIEYDADNEAVRCVNLYGHKHELWHLAPSPHASTLLFTTHDTGSERRASLWQIPDESDTAAHASGTLRHVDTLDPILVQSAVQCMVWSPHDASSVLSVDQEALHTWSLADGALEHKGTSEQTEGALQHKFGGGAWDPHSASVAATWAGASLALWDLRTMRQTTRVEAAHAMGVTHLDFNPNRQHILASGGESGSVRVWDMRSCTSPLLEFSPHSTSVCRLLYNPKHDRLLLTSSTDNNVVLSRVLSVASSNEDFPADPNGGAKEGADDLVQTFSQHEDSVYAAAWSLVDPWVFASVSYDGVVRINSVPCAEKYKILL